MFRDCWRCGHGWYTVDSESMPCPVCSNAPDHTAQYIKDMYREIMDLRKIARKAIYTAATPDDIEQKFSNKELRRVGIYV